MERKIKNQKGITLVALVITIIVMLILVAVSVTVAINGGLFEQAKEASNKWEDESQIEADGNIVKVNVDGTTTTMNIDGAINTLKERPTTQTPAVTTSTFSIKVIWAGGRITSYSFSGEKTWEEWIAGQSKYFLYDNGTIGYREEGTGGNSFKLYWPNSEGVADKSNPVLGNQFIENGIEYIEDKIW